MRGGLLASSVCTTMWSGVWKIWWMSLYEGGIIGGPSCPQVMHRSLCGRVSWLSNTSRIARACAARAAPCGVRAGIRPLRG